jgi:ATP-binding cassette, subfamily C, bacterial LapB
MDTMFQARLAKNIGKFIGDRTPIVVIHRAPVLQLVDRLIWLEGGKVIAMARSRGAEAHVRRGGLTR